MASPAINFFLLAGVKSPGIATFPEGVSSPRKWDEQKGYGTSARGTG